MFRKFFLNRNLSMLWLGQVVSQSGDSIYQIGLLWLVLELSGSEAVTGFVAMSAYLPSLLLSLFAGVAADRYRRRRIMMGADLLRTGIVLLIPLCAIVYHLSSWFLAVNAFAIVAASVFFYPARDSLLPHLVRRDQLLRANTLIQTSWQFSLLLGPAVAAVLLEYFGKVQLFTATSFFFFSSFLFIYLIRIDEPREIRADKNSGLREMSQGLSYAAKHPVLLPLLLLTIADNLLIMGPATVGTPIFVKQELSGTATAYATTEVSYAVGMLIGTGLMLYFGKRFKRGKLLLWGMFFDGVTFIPLYYVDTLLALQVTFVVHSIAIPFLIVPRAAIIQSIVPENLTGRIFALINFAVVGVTAISSGLTGIAVELFGVRMVFLIIGVGGGVCGLLGWFFANRLRETT